MLNKIIYFSIKNKLVIGILTVGLIIWGIWSANKLPIDALPDITDNQVQIITRTPTLATQEVEQFVTYPIEKAMANLPDIMQMRSFSRFGLSVITIVFNDNVNIYFARQLISEKLKLAEKEIPERMGRPELAPVTTGLGEIYQYVIHPKKGSESKYSAMDLRTMQDWIVSRQLYGIPGVAEVTGFGGITKQYEVSVNPDRLKAMNVTLPEIFNALENNNENTGGAYIDKKPNAYFIRGVGMVRSISDIENIDIKNSNKGIPVLIKDVAKVQFGSPPRYGALTYNGEKEVVGGLVLMLKGANSAQVVQKVKERMKTVQQSLPADVVIEPFLDRSELVGRAIGTVEKNLIEGALIVIFVLMVFLGNLRAGLIVASAIPLSLLFAMGMMNLFGVSANLMSLGAIDFGLIVDGAVIIVEATMHHLGLRKSIQKLSQTEMDQEVFESASKIRKSAAFGEIIILIVYIPILTLIGIEGKMFRPMAQTVSFAIVGALLLSVTYIPMVSALFLSKKAKSGINFSDKMMQFFQRLYEPLLKKAIAFKYWVVGISVIVFIITVIIFSRIGGEFIPTLEEGDYAIEFVLPQGTSLGQTIETVMQAQKIVKTFPEVKMVVGKTGAADVATDPMPMNQTDLIVVLKNKKEWQTSDDFYELAEKMKQKLDNIPGVIAEPSQPIQMRFNELMTGIRQDVAIKIFGENLDTLAALAPKYAKAIQTIKGVSEPLVERTAGLPQITVEYDRARIAGYGLNIKDVNQVVSTAFAGQSAGVVFENERKFELVVRLDSTYRTSLNDVSNLFVPGSGGAQVPLSQVATVSFKEGPVQISREDGKRRVVVGFNVRGRDIESVVEEIQQKLKQPQYQLPAGYYITYGGTFENLQKASARLQIAVPVALLLIFVLLYFTFHSVGQATLIYTAIPMSAIGGVFALLVRGMPFSISAGVGFIALFGVAVLNGIVLISTFNQLRIDGRNDVVQRVMEGTRVRLRPVLMTATVASLGFLPMAISTGAGAEVQKPLATVVIGGLISATILTLIVLPCLYIIFSRKQKMKLKTNVLLIIAFLLFLSPSLSAQVRMTPQAAVDSAMKSNQQFRINESEINKASLDVKTSKELPKTGLFVENEDMRPSDNQGILKIGLSQSIAWPGVYRARKEYFSKLLKYYELNTAALNAVIRRDVRSAYYDLWYLQDKSKLFYRLDSIYNSLFRAAELRVKTGEAAGLDKIVAEAKMKEVRAMREQNAKDILVQQRQLGMLLNVDTLILPTDGGLEKMAYDIAESDSIHPSLQLLQQNVNIAKSNVSVQRNLNRPEFSGRFFSQRLYGLSDPFSGFSVAATFPLFGVAASKNKVKSAQAEQKVKQLQLNYQSQALQTQQQQMLTEIQKNQAMLNYYETSGLKQSEEIIRAATLSYNAGEISFAELSQYLSQAISTKQNFLEVLNNYNQSVIRYNFYSNK
ncbi:MAG: CusA/CzcA family heavy metal efflux RND transporter [Chitinophagaceae bacterium]|nr:CusA/CzcA family heavy metal efflux RND transporter [Chitinophagaceae bacterium]